jgi:peroxiredoxin
LSLYELPQGLPVPVDDGRASHLIGMKLPSIELPSTSGVAVNLSALSGWSVIYCYPMTGRPNVPLPEGWDEIPGARGCTPQSCAFRDHHAELRNLGASVFGLSTQTRLYQSEMANRLHLPFDVLSDNGLQLCNALSLPIITVDKMTLLKRLTMICHSSIIRHIHYPIFPPQEDADYVIKWLRVNQFIENHNL